MFETFAFQEVEIPEAFLEYQLCLELSTVGRVLHIPWMLCHGYMRQKPHLYRFKSLHASKVEVQDYKLICLARVEIGDQKLHLIGILGGWWSLPSSLGIYFLAQEQCSSTSLR